MENSHPTTELRFGEQGSIQFRLPAEAIVAQGPNVGSSPIADPAAAAIAAMQTPLDFPPIDEATVPGDQIVIALDDGVPQAAQVVAGVVQALLAANAQPEDITILCPPNFSPAPEEELRAALPASIAARVKVQVHDPEERGQLSYLAATEDEGEPIYVNRLLVDSDVVVPISCVRMDEVLGSWGLLTVLYPVFSDTNTRQMFRDPALLASRGSQKKCRKRAGEVAWLLGSRLVVAVVPGTGEHILHVLAGDLDAVNARSHELCEAAWNFHVPQRASLVIAAIEGGPHQQTWENFARVLAATEDLVQDDGAIVICSEIDASPGPALARLSTDRDETASQRRLRKDRSADAIPASLLLNTLQRVRVFLLSKLDEETVEDLGMGHVEQPADVVRLASRHPDCILVASAQFACPKISSQA